MDYQDKFVEVDGLKLRYIEEGSGPSVLFLHGASLGSSADVFRRNLGPFAKAGFHAVAFDYPGFGLSDVPEKQSTAQQRNSIPKFIDSARLGKTALVAHSRSGGFAIQLALEDPNRYSHVIILGTGSWLPPQTQEQVGKYEAVQARVARAMAQKEPAVEDARIDGVGELLHLAADRAATIGQVVDRADLDALTGQVLARAVGREHLHVECLEIPRERSDALPIRD